MRIIPVLDIQNGQVVRAVAGNRADYRPIRSKLVDTSDPGAVARKLLDISGSRELYIADLDSIRGPFGLSPSVGDVLHIPDTDFWIDCGIRDTCDFAKLPKHPNWNIVVATETARDFSVVPDGGVFSIDLKNGYLQCPWHAWGLQSPTDALGLAEWVIGRGIATLIVLDLAGVGVCEGPKTLALCREIRAIHPDIELLTGGGIRNSDDLNQLEDIGVDGVLVASALHDGHLPATS